MKYKWKIDKHPKGLGWIIYEWKNAKLTSWNSGNFSSEELAQTRLNQRKAMLNKENLNPVRKMTKEEVALYLGQKSFPKRKQLKDEVRK